MWVSLWGYRSVGEPIELLYIQDEVRGQQPRIIYRNWPAQSVFGCKLLTGCYSQSLIWH